MSERELREALQAAPLDDAARARSWRVVQAAYRTLPPPGARRARPRRWVGIAVAASLALALATVAATRSPTDALAWLRDAVGIGDDDRGGVLDRVPGGGRLLVSAGGNAWVVAPDGAKRRLGRYDGAAWSPRGLFVVGWRGGELTALEPDGDVRWSVGGPDAIRMARWAPGDGYRIAYVAGTSLRVVNGDGSGDRRFAAAGTDVAPAWRPGAGHVLTYTGLRGVVRVADVDSGRVLWRSRAIRGIRSLAWTPGGRRLLVLTGDRIVLFDRDGTKLSSRLVNALRAAWSPAGDIALTTLDVAANRGQVVLLDPVGGRRRVLFTAPGALGPVTWSPDGRLLLVSWPDADQWLFFSPAQRRRPVRSVAGVAAQFAPGAVRTASPSSVEWVAGSG